MGDLLVEEAAVPEGDSSVGSQHRPEVVEPFHKHFELGPETNYIVSIDRSNSIVSQAFLNTTATNEDAFKMLKN